LVELSGRGDILVVAMTWSASTPGKLWQRDQPIGRA
jgi:hypothetical protein